MSSKNDFCWGIGVNAIPGYRLTPIVWSASSVTGLITVGRAGSIWRHVLELLAKAVPAVLEFVALESFAVGSAEAG